MSKLTLYMPNKRRITFKNLSRLYIRFSPKENLFILGYSDDFYKSNLICTHKNLSIILDVQKKINQAYLEGKSKVNFSLKF